MNVQHSSKCQEWMTPISVLDRARMVLGPIDLDPASSEEANRRVGAARFFTKDDCGIVNPWERYEGDEPALYINPPGGTSAGRVSNAYAFWHKLMEHWSRHAIRHAIFMGFSLEILQSSQKCPWGAVGDFVHCIPRQRLRFDLPGGGTPLSPSHANVITYVPGTLDKSRAFAYEFQDLGGIYAPYGRVRP